MSDDAAVIEHWWQQWLQHPQALPPGLTLVQGRLIRSVGRGQLPSGEVFVKLMAFPRAKDRLRYCLRPLPAAHEARLLAATAAVGVPCPEVVAVRTARRGAWPRASMLVLRALPAAASPAPPERELEDRATLARCLLDHGIWHPDLNAGNFVRLADGRLAVLDLQSARRRSLARCRRGRIAVAARLLRDAAALPPVAVDDALMRSGLLQDESMIAAASVRADAEARAWLRGRILRCWRESTDFTVRCNLSGRTWRRRGYDGEVTEIRGGRELIDCWMGDRALEVMENRKPSLVALFRRWRWFPGPVCAYIPASFDATNLGAELMVLQEGFQKYRSLLVGCGPDEVPRQ